MKAPIFCCLMADVNQTHLFKGIEKKFNSVAVVCQGQGGPTSRDKCHLQSSHCCVTLSLSFNHSGLITLPSIYPLLNPPLHLINFMSTCYVPATGLHTYLMLNIYNQHKDEYSRCLTSRSFVSEKHKQINCKTTLLVLNQGSFIRGFEDG